MGLIRVLKVYPNRDGVGTGSFLSLYLLSESNEKDYVRAKLRVLNQIGSNHVEKQGECFSTMFFDISENLKRGKKKKNFYIPNKFTLIILITIYILKNYSSLKLIFNNIEILSCLMIFNPYFSVYFSYFRN